jgi:hypothetical protein
MEITIVFSQVFMVVLFGGFGGLTAFGAMYYGERFIAKRRYYRSTRYHQRERKKLIKKLYQQDPAHFLNPYK